MSRSGSGGLRCSVRGVRDWLVGLTVLAGRLRPSPVRCLAIRLRLLRIAGLSRTAYTSEEQSRRDASLAIFSVAWAPDPLSSTTSTPCACFINCGPVELSSRHAARVIRSEASVCVECILRLYRAGVIETIGETTPTGSRETGTSEARRRESSREEGARESECGQRGAPVC